jgi:hypothetical protein
MFRFAKYFGHNDCWKMRSRKMNFCALQSALRKRDQILAAEEK